MKAYIAAFLFIIANLGLKAQDDKFTATAPANVQVGQQFQYVIQGSRQGDVRLPDFRGFQLLAGPFSSYSSQTQWVNGKRTMEVVASYTYVLMANDPGEFIIPPATISIRKKEYSTNELKIVVSGSGQVQQQGGNSANSQAGSSGAAGSVAPASGGSAQANEQEKGKGDASEAVFLRLIPSRSTVWAGEQFVCGLKVYTRINTRPANTGRDLPFEGFYKKQLEPDASPSRQVIDGQQYISQVIQRHILIPQKTGKITIDAYESEWMIPQRVQRRSGNSLFDSFFDDPFFNSVQEVPQKLYTRPLTIIVKPLPAGEPSGFTGGVGDFKLQASLSQDEVKVNEALSLKLTIHGSGNLPLLGEPEVSLPPDHDIYDVTRSVNTNTTGNRINGSVTFEYPIVARHAGRFRISPIKFSWFDPASGNYKTASTEEFSFTVLKGEQDDPSGSVYVPGNIQESVDNLGTDIRDIARTTPVMLPLSYTLMGTLWFRLLFPILVLLSAALIILIRVSSRRNADLKLVRNRKANRQARMSLKVADKYRKTGENDRFYEETGKAIWIYLADKLGIEISALGRESIARELEHRKVPVDLVEDLLRILDDSEFSRFAPSSETTAPDQLYQDAVRLIKNLENRL